MELSGCLGVVIGPGGERGAEPCLLLRPGRHRGGEPLRGGGQRLFFSLVPRRVEFQLS